MSARLFMHEEAAAYCGMSPTHFDAHIRPHVPALEFGAKRLWDRCAIDVYLDRLSGLGDNAASSTEWAGRVVDRAAQRRKGRPR